MEISTSKTATGYDVFEGRGKGRQCIGLVARAGRKWEAFLADGQDCGKRKTKRDAVHAVAKHAVAPMSSQELVAALVSNGEKRAKARVALEAAQQKAADARAAGTSGVCVFSRRDVGTESDSRGLA